MINTRIFKYIPIEEHEYYYNILLQDVYYFYHCIKMHDNIKIICKNGIKYELSKDNLMCVDNNLLSFSL